MMRPKGHPMNTTEPTIDDVLTTLVDEWAEFMLHGKSPDGAVAIARAKTQLSKLISDQVAKAARLAWNMSAEGWNAEYTGVHRDVEEEIVKSVVDTLNGVKNETEL